MRCEYDAAPRTIDHDHPRFSWQLSASVSEASQSAFQIQVTVPTMCKTRGFEEGASTKLEWDSDRVDSSRSRWVEYAGKPLRPMTRYAWRVRVWDAQGVGGNWSEPSIFETGRRDLPWIASWIGGTDQGSTVTPGRPPMLRRNFTLNNLPARAKLCITALGLHACSINGQRISDEEFSPGWTDYHRRVVYRSYDVTALLQRGENVIGVVLGDGWYCGRIAWFGRENYGERPALLAELRIEMDDGKQVVISSDEQWRWNTGPLLYSDLLDGESYDARQERPGWDAPGGDEGGWKPVEVFQPPGCDIVAPVAPPVRAIRRIPSERIDSPDSAISLYDLKQNISGRCQVMVRGPRGSTIRLRYGEMLQQDGSLYTENLRSAAATDWYTLRGDDKEETYTTAFTFHGFQYVEVRSATRQTVEVLAVEGVVLHNDMDATGSFGCSEPLLNQLFSNQMWGQRGNYLEAPTDCPQRDERLGWTGDAQVYMPTACFNYDTSGFMAKWLQDLRDSQDECGRYPRFAPNPSPNPSDRDGGPAWSEAGIICAWQLWLHYGDRRVLEDHYPSMQRFEQYLEQTSQQGIRPIDREDVWPGFGDWLALDNMGDDRFGATPRTLIGTAYHIRSLDLLAKIAVVLDDAENANRYLQRATTIRRAFQKKFVKENTQLAGHTQTSYLLALAFDILPDPLRPAALKHLLERLDHYENHLSTGFVGTPLLCPVLTRFGKTDLAYRLIMNRTYPGWLYSILQGATTMWERWNSYTRDRGFGPVEMNSFNHYAYGAIGHWMYETILGIQPLESHPGFKHFRLCPQPGGGLTHARGGFDSPYGPITVEWKLADHTFSCQLRVPPNTTAEFILPRQTKGGPGRIPTKRSAPMILSPGDYSF